MDDLEDLLGEPVRTSILDAPLRVTRFLDRTARTKIDGRVSLRELSRRIGDHAAEIKADLPWIKLAPFGDKRTEQGSLRHNVNMLSVSGVEGDYDDGNVTPAEAAERLEDAGIAAWIYTSPSHTTERPRWRVLAPLSREMPVSARRELCGRLNAALGGILTTESFTDSQSYYFGRLVDSDDFESILVDGASLDRLTLAPEFPEGVSTHSVEYDDLELIAKQAAAERSLTEDLESGRLAKALIAIAENPSDDGYRGDWATVVQALCHATGGSKQGYEIWTNWVKRSPRAARKDVGERLALRQARGDWNRYTRRGDHGNPVTLASIYDLAQNAAGRRFAAEDEFEVDLVDDDEDILGLRPLDDEDDILGPSADAETPRPRDPGVNPRSREQWLRELDVNDEGQVKSTLPNLEVVLENDDRLYGRVGFNELTQCIVFAREPAKLRKKARDGKPIRQLTGPLWTVAHREMKSGRRWIDANTHSLRAVYEAPRTQGGYGLKITDRDINAAIENVARKNTFHPVRDYLRELKWDGKPRIDSLFVDYVGAENTPYHRQAGRLVMVGAVARAMEPGCKFDFVAILEGGQGIRKSTFINVLGRDWYAELKCDLNDNKSVVENLQGGWIYELPELQGFSKAETTTLKAMLSTQIDRARVAYGRLVQEFPRQCIFLGSTNEEDYLKDTTGGRRFWPIRCGTEPIDIDRLRRNIDQMWAEAVAAYDEMRRGQPYGELPLDMRDKAAASEALLIQDSRRPETPEEMLASEIARKLDEPEHTDLDGATTPRNRTCIREVWIDLLGRDARELDSRLTANLVGKALRIAGWEQAGTMKHPKYGVPKAWRRR